MARRLTAALIALLLPLALAGCSDDPPADPTPDDAPRAAEPADFCTAWTAWSASIAGGAGPQDDAEQAAVVASLRRDAAALQEVGTPAEIPDDARDGFETLLETISGLSEESSTADLTAPFGLEGDDATAVAVHTAWADGYCA